MNDKDKPVLAIIVDKEDFRLLLTMHRKEARTDAKIKKWNDMAEGHGWRYCERCGTYEEYDDDKCKRCGAPLFKYSARGEGNV